MRVTPLMAVSLAFALACGGGSDTTAPSSGGMNGGSNLANVNIQDFSFSPAAVTIKVGGTVVWHNLGPSPHTTISDNGVWASGTLASPSGGGGYGGGSSAGGSFQFTFTQAGTFGYHCNIHPPSLYPGFVGTITVTP